ELILQRFVDIMGYIKKKWGMNQLRDDMEGLGSGLYKLEELEYKVELFGWSRLTWSKRERCGHFKDQEMDCGACKHLVGEGEGMRPIISMVSISLEGFLPSILLLVVIIVAVVIVAVILIVVVIDVIVGVVIVVVSIGVVVVIMIIGIIDGDVSHIIKLSFVIIGKSPDESFHNFLNVCPGDPIGLFYSDRLSICIPPRQGIYLGLVFLLGLSAFVMATACAFWAAATPSVISC
nr:hypothetical protein [Tanacetum cinerariifolium]